MLRTLIVASLFMLMGCSGVTATEIRREPAKVRIIDIDTRPVPQASRQGTLDTCHPLARAIVLASLAVPPDDGVTVDPDGRVRVGKGVAARVTVSEAEGDRPEVTPPTGGKAKSTALDFIVNTTKVPANGAGLLLAGGLLVAGGVAAWFLGAGARIALALGLAGLALVGIAYMIQTAPWVIWLALAAICGVVAFQVWEGRKGQDRREAVETIVPVVESIPDILTRNMVAAFPDLDGAKVADAVKRAAGEVKTRIRKGAESGKVAARVDRAVDDAKAAMGTATTFRGS